jgi:mannose-6-phosphate isomerase-like protein (cupin superfamily)
MIELNHLQNLTKEEVFRQISQFIEKQGLTIVQQDLERPWGGFFVLDESQIRKFKDLFFADVDLTEEQFSQKLSPKFLLVAPGQRLSWQYHFRRAELWKLIGGESGIVRGATDEQGEVLPMNLGVTISLQKGERHRLVGLQNWGVVAEIWMHSDPENPSDESDIVRLQDDYSRK